jgi:hypothetical protein
MKYLYGYELDSKQTQILTKIQICQWTFKSLWTGVLPYAPYRSLSISELFCEDGGGGVDVEGFVMNSEGISGGWGGGGRCVMNS